MNQAAITGTGLYTPPSVITNQELVASYNTYVEQFNNENQLKITTGEIRALQPSSVEFIEKASGIKQRHVVDKIGILDIERMRPYLPHRSPELPSLQCEMAIQAIEDAMKKAQISAADIDVLIVACSNFERAYPAIAIEILHFLDAQAAGFDLNVACSSATFGIAQAVYAIESNHAQTVVVVNPEICSGHLNFRDRESHFIFGDAATACVIQSKKIAKAEHFDILDVCLSTHFSNNIRNNQGFLTPAEAKTHETIPHYLFEQNGRKVFKEVVPMVSEHLLAHLSKHSINPLNIKRLWLHQANQAMNELIAKKVLNQSFNLEISPIILDRYANTSSAGSIICFHEYHHDLNIGDIGIICSFGAGYSIGSVIIKKAQWS